MSFFQNYDGLSLFGPNDPTVKHALQHIQNIFSRCQVTEWDERWITRYAQALRREAAEDRRKIISDNGEGSSSQVSLGQSGNREVRRKQGG